MLRIIDNKRIDLTTSEYQLYQELVKAYTVTNRSGEEYFKDLFETDQNGIIIFLKPPSKSYTSMECYMFLVNVCIHQHLGAACEKVDSSIADVKSIIKEAKEVTAEMRSIIDEFKKVRGE